MQYSHNWQFIIVIKMKSSKAEQTNRKVNFSNSYQWFAVKPRQHIK